MLNTFPLTEATLLLPGPAGQLEILATPAKYAQPAATAIICHPHPLFGGTMQNKVVTTLSRAFHNLGLCTVRFNFRGVGKSTGHYAEGVGEIEDLLAVIQWTKQANPDSILWLSGFSFGAYIAASVATRIEVAQLVLIAPAVQHFPMMSLPPLLAPCLVVQGDKDDVVSPGAVYEWANTRHPHPELIRFPQATHFFHGQLTELRNTIEKRFLSLP
ncbi:MAG: alpha/beta hydrolase [Gammaproteobacteria bacterium RIFCSPHIGHO2_12_FULL_41_20]|nr:MAG: alpha/beta hydrolase [Gammaproteobacteria bacterium RIFCSPHIGHO2_12_FULL_41_20]